MNRRFNIKYLLCIVFCILYNFVFSQRPQQSNTFGFPTRSSNDSLRQKNLNDLPDSSIFKTYFIESVQSSLTYSDTTLKQFHKYDPGRRSGAFQSNLGNLGSAQRSLLFKPRTYTGFSIGIHPYDDYKLKSGEFQFFDLNRPFTYLFFSPVSGQENFMIKTKFSRDFQGDINFTIDYQRILQEGFYTSQETRSTYLGIGFHKSTKNHDLYLTGIINANNEEQNGGISDITLFNEPFYNFRERVPTNLSGANTRHANVNIAINNYYHFVDTIGNKRGISLHHELSLDKGSYKFFDESITGTEFDFYGDFLTDDRGMRFFNEYVSLENKIDFLLRKDKSFEFNTGILFSHHSLDIDGASLKQNNFLILSRASYSLKNKVILDFDGNLALLDNRGDFNLDASFQFIPDKSFNWFSKIKLFAQEPTLLEDHVRINQIEVWNNEFSKKYGTRIEFGLAVEKLKVNVKSSYTLLKNPIFFDQSVSPVQSSDDISIFQFQLNFNPKLLFFQLENSLFFQTFSENLYQLPALFSEHELYIEGLIFKKKILARIGLNSRILQAFNPPAFSPVIGVFYQQNDYEQKFMALTDFYTSFKISRFRAYIRFENLNQLLFNEQFFLVKDYPQFDFKFRLGVSWQLID